MKRIFCFFLFVLLIFSSKAQLKDIKLLIPKDIPFTMSDFTQFMPDEKYFVVLGNSLSVFNTETCEIIDDYELNTGSKNLSISRDGKYILATVNTELFVFTWSDQKLKLQARLTTADLIKDQPNSQYYGMLPIGASFFTSKPGQIYASIGSFTMLYDLPSKKILSTHTFSVSDYILSACEYAAKQEVIMTVSSGTVNSIIKQSLNDLNEISTITTNAKSSYKLRLKDSLLCCINVDVTYVMNLQTGKIIHEIMMPKTDYGTYADPNDPYQKESNIRIPITKFDSENFTVDEFIYDFDYLSKAKTGIYSTSKGIHFINLETKKQIKFDKSSLLNIRISNAGNRMISNGYTSYKALRVYDPADMRIISERPAMGNPVYQTNISPGNRWLYTSGGISGFLWDLTNFTKYAEIRHITGGDSSFVYNGFFLNDSEIVINSGSNQKNINLYIYDIKKKKYKRTLKQGVQTWASGFMNGEYYYCTQNDLFILDLKTAKEEKYEGYFSLANSPLYQVVNFTDELVFIPEAGKYKVVNRKTKKVEYQSDTWALSSRVTISPDSRNVFTASMITKKKNFSGTEIDIPTNAVVKIDMQQKKVTTDYAETYNAFDFKIKNKGKTIGVWYIKHDVANYNATDKENVYSEYNVETGKEEYTKTLCRTPDIVPYHFTSDSGKYFALVNHMGNYFKVFDAKGEEIIDLSEMKISIPTCFFIEKTDVLIITSVLNSVATFVDLKNKKVMGQLANAKGDDYFMVTSDLHYLGSKDFIKTIRFKYQSEMFSFDQFDAYLNQPHKVLRAFKCTDSTLIHAYETAYLKRMRVLGLKPGAKINFSVLPGIQNVVMREEKNGKVNFSIAANKGQSNLAKMEVINNGTKVYSENIPTEQATRFESNLSFETSSGINRFEFIIKDQNGLESPRITRFYNNINIVKPDLYLVVIASEKFKNSDFDLSYALKDASDVANTMANSKSFGNIYTKKLVNQNFVSDTVKSLKNFFAKAGINDLVMVFYAGHGYLDSDMSYYFPTYYTDFSDPKINSVAYNSFEKLFREMKPIRKLMFIDACFSGEVDMDEIKTDKKKKSGKDSTRTASSTMFSQSTALEMSKAVFSDLRLNSGATVISSAGGTEAAYEDEKWNNGLFTYCLINGLKNLKADANSDKKVTLNELQKYVSEEVNKLSDGKQTPTYRVENTVLDYELW